MLSLKYLLQKLLIVEIFSILLTKGGPGCAFEVFNDIGEKVGQCEANYKPKSILDMQEDLEDLGFII